MTDDTTEDRRSARRAFLVAGAAGIAGAPMRAFAQVSCGALPTSWDASVDVIVIGSGFAGCAAAAAASEAGSSVAVIEKMPRIGGNSALNLGDFAAWDSELKLRQKHSRGEDSAEQHARDM